MSAASKWKMKEKEAMASAAADKTDVSRFKALKTDAPGTGGAAGASDVLGRGGSLFASKTSTALETQKPIAANSAAPGDRQGGHSKLPLGKDNVKTPQTNEVKGPRVTYPGASFVSSGVSKIPVGDKESASNSGGRRSFGGVGSRMEEPTKTKEADVQVSQTKKDEADKDAATAFAAGRTKGLAGFWATQTDDVKAVKKKRLTAVEDTLAPTIVENFPRPLEGVVRSEDPGEWTKPVQTPEGWTRNVASSLQTQRNAVANRAPVSLHDNACLQDTDIETAVRVKGISQPRPQSEPQRPREKKAVVDRSQDSIVLAENQPEEADPDVVRSESAAEEVVLEKGRTRNLLQHWKNTEVEYNATKTSTSRFEGTKPAWILEIEAAKGNLGGNDEDYEDEDEITESQTEEKMIANTIATKDSERDKTRKRNGGYVDKAAASFVESRGVDKKLPLKREGIVASGETKSASAYFKGQEKSEQPVSVRHLKPDCRRIEQGDGKFSHIRADEDQKTSEIKDTRSVGEGASSVIPSFDQNARNKTSASSFENASRRERKNETLTGYEPHYLPSEKPAMEEFRAWHGTADASTVQNVKRSTAYEINKKTSAEDTASSKISSTTQSEVGGDHIRHLPDSSTLGTGPKAEDAELKQTNVFEAELFEQGKPKAAERGSNVDSFSSSVQPGVLEISTTTVEGAHPESAAFSEFNPLTADPPFISSPGYNEKPEPVSSPSLDDLLRIDSPSFPLGEGVDSTPCLLPTWSIAVENTVENRENYFDYAQADIRQNEAPVFERAVESSVDEPSNYRRADKIEATKKSEPSQRSCCVM